MKGKIGILCFFLILVYCLSAVGAAEPNHSVKEVNAYIDYNPIPNHGELPTFGPNEINEIVCEYVDPYSPSPEHSDPDRW